MFMYIDKEHWLTILGDRVTIIQINKSLSMEQPKEFIGCQFNLIAQSVQVVVTNSPKNRTRGIGYISIEIFYHPYNSTTRFK